MILVKSSPWGIHAQSEGSCTNLNDIAANADAIDIEVAVREVKPHGIAQANLSTHRFFANHEWEQDATNARVPINMQA